MHSLMGSNNLQNDEVDTLPQKEEDEGYLKQVTRESPSGWEPTDIYYVD